MTFNAKSEMFMINGSNSVNAAKCKNKDTVSTFF